MSVYNMEDLRAALLKCALERYKDIPAEEEIDYTFSEKFEKWAQKLIKRTPDKKKQSTTKFSTRSIKVLILVAALIAALAATALAVPAIREALVDFFLNDHGDHFGITFDPKQVKDAPNVVEEYRIPQYVPKGFELIDENKNANGVFIAWLNKNDEIIVYHQLIIQKDPADSNGLGINSENVKKKAAILGGYKIDILQDREMYTTIWTDNEYLFYMEIPNSVPLSEFERILASIKPVS